jgi:hypothetical protein
MPPKQFRKIAATMKPMMAPGKLADHRASQDQETAKALKSRHWDDDFGATRWLTLYKLTFVQIMLHQ